MRIFKWTLFFICISVLETSGQQQLEDYKLWLKYQTITNTDLAINYNALVKHAYISQGSPTLRNAKKEVELALSKMLGDDITFTNEWVPENTLVVDVYDNLSKDLKSLIAEEIKNVTHEGFLLKSVNYKNKKVTIES